MAGSGKVSPRQKMINMMYLVLMALLAMNISKEVLDSFETLRLKLRTSAETADASNMAFIDAMKEEIANERDNENKNDNVGLLDTLDNVIRKRTNGLISELEGHINEIKRLGGVDSISGELLQKDQIITNWNYWMGEGDAKMGNDSGNGFGPRGEGAAFGLRDNINDYFKFVVDMYNSQLRGEGSEGKKLKLEDYTLKDFEARKENGEPNPDYNQTWESKTFKGPVGANIAVLEAIKSDIFTREKELLNLLNERLGVATFKIDKIVPVNAPEAVTVAAGLQFKTHLYVAMSSSQVKPSFSGSGVRVDDGGNSATMTLTANGNVIPKGKSEGKQNYSATITVPKATGGSEVMKVEGSFIVRKPEIVVTSASEQNLYRSCGNAINIDVPALGDLYNPVCSVIGGGSITQSPKSKKKFLVVPTGKKADVVVKNSANGATTTIGTVKYRVINPPKPTIQMLVNNKAYNGASPIPSSSRILVQIQSDKEFKAALPDDAKYGVNQIEILGQLSLGPPRRVGTARGGRAEKGIRVSLPSEIRQARPGTKVYVRIGDIYRVNYKGQKVNDPRFNEVERTLSLVTK